MVSGIPVLVLFLLLLFPSFSIKGASDGLLLWFHVVLPTLAPFMICTQVIAETEGLRYLVKPFAPILQRVFGLTPSGSFVLLCGLLCGYPLGARLCADFLSNGKISRQEANYLFSICNHPSPMFLSGYLKAQLPAPIPAALLFVCIYAPILPVSLASRQYYAAPSPGGGSRQPSPAGTALGAQKPGRKSLEEILLSASETMVLIGNYIMLFSILSEWLGHICLFTPRVQAILSGLSEITTGCHQICCAFPGQTAFLPSIAAVSFGGLSGIFQTKGVIKNAGLSIRHYIIWKCFHTALSACLAMVTLLFLPGQG